LGGASDPGGFHGVLTVNEPFADHGKIHVAVNYPGYRLVGAVEESTDGKTIHQINTNLIGSIHAVRGAFPHLRLTRPATPGGDRGVAVGSRRTKVHPLSFPRENWHEPP
jgi:hypothetical protein